MLSSADVASLRREVKKLKSYFAACGFALRKSGLRFSQIAIRETRFPKLLGAEHQATGDHVVEGLFTFGEAGKDVADAQRDEAGDDFGEVAAGGPSEGDAVPVEIGDH